jgi:hypothetical protein
MAQIQKQGALNYGDPRLADHFPSVKSECKEVAAKFFHCFTSESLPKDEKVINIFRHSETFPFRMLTLQNVRTILAWTK